ncbi:MAG: dihydroorotate dehydrogenase-like protein [Verrucomicrobiota bacterium]|jgi:dihydroorotate dehydrogenase (fumarate)
MDLRTTYMGLTLKTPLVVSACQPLSDDIGKIKRIEDAGAAAVVLYSLFEEQLRLETKELDHHLTEGTESFAEALNYFPAAESYHLGPDEYLEHIRKAKAAVKIPVIASLNGSTPGGWTDFAKQIEQAGADALELNIYNIPSDLTLSGAVVEQSYLDVVRAVKGVVKIPVAVKLSPFFSNMANMAKQLDDAGANALVLFNRFYQPDINLDELEVQPSVLLSTPQALRLPLRWLAILHGKIRADLAGTSGVHTAQDALKMLMAGANCTLIASALLAHGVDHLRTMEQGLRDWMEQHWYESVEQMQGSMSQMKCPNPSSFERAQYMRAITSFNPTA